MEQITNKMYEIANTLVGNVGESTETPLSVTGEEYIQYFFCTLTINEIIPAWENWIKSYIGFVPSHFTGKTNRFFSPLFVHWRVKPEAKLKKGVYQCYARLLITNLTAEIGYSTLPEKAVLRSDSLKDAYELMFLAYREHLKWCFPYGYPKDYDQTQ